MKPEDERILPEEVRRHWLKAKCGIDAPARPKESCEHRSLVEITGGDTYVGCLFCGSVWDEGEKIG